MASGAAASTWKWIYGNNVKSLLREDGKENANIG
jgi:hypothetical protein